jgi:hypothetical protein
MTNSPAQIVTDFLTAFHSGQADLARGMAHDDFVLRAPLLDRSAGIDAYFRGAERKARCIRSFRILKQWQDGGEVSTLYEIDAGLPDNHAPLEVFEWHSVADGKIASSHMVFDSNARAVSAMRDALRRLA